MVIAGIQTHPDRCIKGERKGEKRCEKELTREGTGGRITTLFSERRQEATEITAEKT